MTLKPFELSTFHQEGKPTAMYEAVSRRIALGFYADPGDAELMAWGAQREQDMGAVIRGFTDDEARLPGEQVAEHPVATIFGFPNQIELGRGQVPAWMITGVGVAPTHRRRGIFRRMMDPELTRAQQEGYGMAALTVSEGEIYGRFGFGVSTRMVSYELDLTARPKLLPGVFEHSGAAEVQIYQAQGKDLLDHALKLREPMARTRRGQAVRTRAMYENCLGVVNLQKKSLKPDGERQAFLCEGPEGTEGYVCFKHQGWGSSSTGPNRVEVKDFQAVTTRARVALWEQLLNLDLVDFLEFTAAPGAEMSRVITNPRAVRQLRDTDVLWTRILEVKRVLESREFLGDGELVLLVDDPQGLVTGAYHLRIRQGQATVIPGEQAADPEESGAVAQDEVSLAPGVDRVRFPVERLASAVFFGCEPEVRYGAITGEGAEEAARLFSISREPYCDFIF